MSKEPNNIDRLVREKLDGFEMTPPPGVWENTSVSLQALRMKRFLYGFTIGIASIVILGTGAYFYYSGNDINERLAGSNETAQTMESTREPSKEENGLNTNKSVGGDHDSTNELDDTKVSSDGSPSIEDLNEKRNFSSINPRMRSGEFNTERNAKVLNDKSQKGKSLGNTEEENTSLDNPLSSDKFGSRTTNDSKNLARSKSDSRSNSSKNDKSGLPSGDQYKNKYTQTNTDLPHDLSELELNNSLATSPVEFFTFSDPQLEESHIDKGKLSIPNPIWKAFSLEASVGVSTFENKAVKKTTGTELFTALNNASSNRNGLDVNFGLNYHLNSKFSLQTGLEYSTSKEDYAFNTVETTTFQYFDSIATSLDSVTGDSIYTLISMIDSTTTNVVQKGTNLYKTLTIPFHFAWTQPIGARSKLEFALGGALNIYSQNTGSVILDTNNLIPSEQAYLKTGMLSLGGSVKYLYYFGNHHAVYIQPWAQFGITNQSTPALNYESMRRKYGVRVGYRFHL